MTRRCFRRILPISIAIMSAKAYAVPTAFLLTESGNQRDANWRTVESKKFKIYHEDKAQHMAYHALRSVESAWPYLSYIFNERMGIENDSERIALRPNTNKVLFSPVTLVLNSRADVGGFANFATQNIEVQTQTSAPGSLFQHELVHHIMYERMDPQLGPAGRTFTIGMMPTWWIEGVAEYLTESMGRSQTNGISRIMAIRNSWPTWDSLHNLYNTSGDHGKGYVTAGRFFGFLRAKASTTPISDMHDIFFWRSFVPPFITASKLATSKIWDTTGPQLYDDFQRSQKTHWTQELAGMPWLQSNGSSRTVTKSHWTPPSILLDNKTLLQGALDAKPYESALVVTDLSSSQKTRIPLNIEGSSVFALAPWERSNGGFWTTTQRVFSNGTSGSTVHYTGYKNDITTINDSALKQRVIFPIGTQKQPIIIEQIRALGMGKAFAIGSEKGDSVLFYIDAEKKSFQEKHRWTSPTRVKLLESSENFNTDNLLCAKILLDADQDQTSLESFCANGQRTTIIPAGKISLLNAFERGPDSFLAHVAWKNVTGIVEIKNGNIVSGFPIPEWGEGLLPWGKEGDNAAFWSFNGEGYDLIHFKYEKAMVEWKNWANLLPSTSPWKSIPTWTPFTPPFVKIAEQEKAILPKSEKTANSEHFTPTPATPLRTSAPYAGRSFFTLPNVLPPYLGGWSVGVISIPYMDEMERHRIEVSGQYDFVTKSPSLLVSYVSNRIFDGFSLSAHRTSRYNGILYNQYCKSSSSGFYESCGSSTLPVAGKPNIGFDTYLRDTGLIIATNHRFLPSSISTGFTAQISQIEPHTEFISDSEVSAAGAQHGLIGTIGTRVGGQLHENAFYMGPKNEVGHRYLAWRTSYSLSGETHHSVGKPRNYDNKALSEINFQKFRLAGKTSLSYRSHSISLNGEVGGTTGVNPLLLREVFQPYRTYLLGSGSAINGVNIPILGDNGVFGRSTGTYSFRSDINYSFPILDNIDYELFIFYLESLRGELVVGRGGVARTERFQNIFTRDSASVAIRSTINIKGFQIFPSVAYGQLIGEPGWSLFSELSFSQFF